MPQDVAADVICKYSILALSQIYIVSGFEFPNFQLFNISIQLQNKVMELGQCMNYTFVSYLMAAAGSNWQISKVVSSIGNRGERGEEHC